MSVFALEFPPLGHIVDWPGWFGTEGSVFEFNKIVLNTVVPPFKPDFAAIKEGPKTWDYDQWYREKQPMK